MKPKLGFRFDGYDEPSQNEPLSTKENNCVVFATMLDSNTQLPDTIEQIMGYISGFVAKKTKFQNQLRRMHGMFI